MKAADFIFSNRLPHRISRHLVFWLVFLVYFYYVNLIPSKPEDLLNSKTYFDAFKLMIYFPVSVISVYVAIYFLLPRFILPEKYVSLFFIVIGLTIIYFFLALLITMLLARLTTNIPFQKLPVSFKWFQPVRYGIGLPLTSAVLTTIIKLFKTWQKEQKENELLQRHKIETEMQLLKTQFQPHFLYDSLQHILFLIRTRSDESASTVLKLSDLLSYILYENEKESVSLEKEFEMVRAYIGLKKRFYPSKLKIQFEQQAINDKLLIAPLLLVSLVEDCFENFLLSDKRKLDLVINIKTKDKELYFQLECKNSFATELKNNKAQHQWIKSFKRIEMLYPGRYHIEVETENEPASLLLILELDEIGSGIKKENEEFILS
jgi:sensor histidine kinase YesM